MGRSRTTRALGAAAVLTAAAVLLAGCGSLRDTWGGGTGSTQAAAEPSSTTPVSLRVVEPGRGPPQRPRRRERDAVAVAVARTDPDAPHTDAVGHRDTDHRAQPDDEADPGPSPTTKPRTSLVRGDSGPKVLALQKRLSELGYWLGTPDGAFGSLTQQAVWAFQKSAGLERDGVVGPRTSKALAAGIRPRATLSGNGVEIDLDARCCWWCVAGRSAPSSTPRPAAARSTRRRRATTRSPRRRAGRFTVYRAVDGEVTNSLGTLWRPRFFNRGIAVHGSQNIPPWPDSHGCARLSNAAIDMIWASD